MQGDVKQDEIECTFTGMARLIEASMQASSCPARETDNIAALLNQTCSGARFAMFYTDKALVTSMAKSSYPVVDRIGCGSGDVLVGFWAADGACVLDLMIGGSCACTLTLGEKEFKYAIDDRFVVPLVCLVFHEVGVRLRSGSMPRLVFAHLDTRGRRHLCQSGAYAPRGLSEGGGYTFLQGMGGPRGGDGGGGLFPGTIILPDMRAAQFSSQCQSYFYIAHSRAWSWAPCCP